MADFDMDQIRYGTYNGRGYAKNCTALVGSLENLARFFANLGEATHIESNKIGMSNVEKLAYSMGYDDMGHSDSIYYWSENNLTLTED